MVVEKAAVGGKEEKGEEGTDSLGWYWIRFRNEMYSSDK